jgi:hypothetical protein
MYHEKSEVPRGLDLAQTGGPMPELVKILEGPPLQCEPEKDHEIGMTEPVMKILRQFRKIRPHPNNGDKEAVGAVPFPAKAKARVEQRQQGQKERRRREREEATKEVDLKGLDPDSFAYKDAIARISSSLQRPKKTQHFSERRCKSQKERRQREKKKVTDRRNEWMRRNLLSEVEMEKDIPIRQLRAMKDDKMEDRGQRALHGSLGDGQGQPLPANIAPAATNATILIPNNYHCELPQPKVVVHHHCGNGLYRARQLPKLKGPFHPKATAFSLSLSHDT